MKPGLFKKVLISSLKMYCYFLIAIMLTSFICGSNLFAENICLIISMFPIYMGCSFLAYVIS